MEEKRGAVRLRGRVHFVIAPEKVVVTT